MANPTTKEALLTAVSDSRRAFATLIHSIDAAQMEIPGVEAEWSVKDIVAHVCSWEASLCRWLAMATSGQIPDQPRSEAEMHQLNAEFTAVNAPKSLQTVLTEFDTLEAQIVQAITAVAESDLFTLGRFPWRPAENPLWYMVGGNTFWHYSEHMPPIERFLQQA